MQTKVNVISESENELEVTLDYKEIDKDMQLAFKEESAKVEIDGFRKGKAPVSLIKKLYGEAIEYKASEKIANKKFWEAVDEGKIKPISSPRMVDLDYQNGVKLSFKVRFEVKPKLALKDYTGQEVEKPVFKANDEEIDREIKQLQFSRGTFEPAETVESDQFQIKIKLVKLDKDGNPDPETKTQEFSVDLFNEGVNKEIVEKSQGKKAGDKFTFSFHDHRHVQENGEEKVVHEDFHYEVEILEVKKMTLPELDEEFIKAVSGNKFTNAEDFKGSLKANYQMYYDSQSENITLNALLGKIVTNNDFTPPPGYVNFLLNNLVEGEKKKAERDKVKGFNPATAREQLQREAEWSAKWQIVMENIAAAENIRVSEEELKEAAQKEADETGISVEKILKYYENINKSDILLEDKVIKFLKEKNTFKEFDPVERQKQNQEAEKK